MSPIEIFLRDCVKDLKRIARATNGDASLDDVKSEAWLMAHDLAGRGDPLDLASADGQDSMLRKLYGKLVMRMQTCIGFARRLDKDWDQSNEDAGLRLCDTLAGPKESDPLHALEQHEMPADLESTIRCSYSQATAYAICLYQWPDPNSLAVYLCIRVETLSSRVRYWGDWIKCQPSLFDGVERMSLDFAPLHGVLVAPKVDIAYDERQAVWLF